MFYKTIIPYQSLGFAIAGLILLPGCAGYQSDPLSSLTIKHTSDKNGTVVFSHLAFTSNESIKYLGKDVLKAGYQPIQITIENNTNHNLIFSPNKISLPMVSADVVAKSVYDGTTGRAVGWGIAGLFIPIFLIPAIVDTCWSIDANKELDVDYQLKSPKEQIIKSGESLNGVVFVPFNKYRSSFTITLIDELTNEPVIIRS